MKRSKKSRNFGYRCRIEKAGERALKNSYGGGHYGSVKTHAHRWAVFCGFCRALGILDLMRIDCQELMERYANWVFLKVENEDYSVPYAHNLISSANRVFSALRDDDNVFISPVEYLGPRSHIRSTVPASLDQEKVNKLFYDLCYEKLERPAAVFLLARALGMRREEAVKADLLRLKKEQENGFVQVLDGTKGGRKADRPVPVGASQRYAIDYALSVRPVRSRNLMERDESYANFAIARSSVINKARAVMRRCSIPGYHDARAAYACERFREETGFEPPVLAGERPDREVEIRARERIAKELGHGRTDVLTSYYGSWQRE